jgi:anti-anti-sigma factor
MPMDLKIGTRSEGTVTLLDLDGSLAIGESEDAFREKVTKLLKEKKTSILVNFENVEFVDSSGVGALIKSLTSVTKAGGKLKGLRPSPMVQKILKITGVYNLFEFFDDEARAIASF